MATAMRGCPKGLEIDPKLAQGIFMDLYFAKAVLNAFPHGPTTCYKIIPANIIGPILNGHSHRICDII